MTRTRVPVALAIIALPVAGARAADPPPPRVALVPNAIAFRSPSEGLLGTGWTSCETGGFGCRPQGTISLTSNGGQTWRVVLRTRQPVVWVAASARIERARLYDGENLASSDGGRTWRPSAPPPDLATPCPPELDLFAHLTVTSPDGREWALCDGQSGAGAMAKAVYRLTGAGWDRVASAPFVGRGHGGIALYGYPLGMVMADDGFGLIWESRGTLYVTRDAGSHWTALPRVAQPETDFGQSAAVLPDDVGFVLLSLEGRDVRRLVETRDAGRTWHVVHRWA